MKTFPFVKTHWLCNFLLLAATLFAPQTTWAQCPNDNTPINTVPFSLTCGTGQETIATGVSGGQYVAMNVVAGSEYTIENCGLSDSGFDTEMTIYEDDGTFIDQNDDDCGTDSRITFIASATGVIRILIDESGCTSNTAETGIVASCTIPPCDITSVSFTNVGACNDNGTPSNPSDDFFTANVVINFINPPATGNLQIVPGGDAIGTTSIPVADLFGNNHTFTNVPLKADGTQTAIEVEFTDPTNPCVQPVTGPTVASCSGAPPSPTNDDCATPTALTCGNTIAGTTIGATPDFGFPGCGITSVLAPGVFYSFTGLAGQTSILLNNCVGNNGNAIRVYTGSCGNSTCVAAEVNTCGTPFTFNTTAGTSYLVYISTGGIGFEGSFDITLTCPPPPPANDNCANPTALTCGNTIAGTTIDATPDFDLPGCGVVSLLAPGVFYSFTGLAGQTSILLDNCVGNDINAIRVYTGSCGNATCVAAEVNTCGTAFTFNTTAGTNYLVYINTGGIGFEGSFNITLTCPPPPPASCEVIGFSFANIGPCNDNGTPSNPADDFFEVDVDVLYSNSFPASLSDVQLVGSDVIGTYSVNGQSGTNLTASFVDVKLRADGQATDLVGQIFVAFLGVQCSLPGTGPAVNSCSNTPPNTCEIIGLSFANIGPCNDNGTPSNPSDDFFEVDVDVLYSNSFPAFFGSVQLVGADVIGTYSTIVPAGLNLTVTFPDVKLRADGQATDLVGQLFVPFVGVQCSLPGTGPAVNDCSNGGSTCAITDIQIVNPEACNDNGTPDPADDFFIADILVFYDNLPATGDLVVSGSDVLSGPLLFDVGNVASTGSPFFVSNKKLRADGTTTSVSAHFTADPNCTRSESTDLSPGPCPCPDVTFVLVPATTVECDGSGNTAQFDAWLAAGGFAQVDSSSGTIVSITHTTPVVNNLCGNSKMIVLIFTYTNDCGNTADIGGIFIIEDTTPPTLTCPGPVQVSCLEHAPIPDITQVTGVSDACGSTPVVVAHISDASGPDGICDNDFTITRTYRATDDCGNAANCTQTITIRDQTPPTITCAAQTTPLNCPATPVFTPPTASDNCVGNVAITFSDVNVPGLCPGTFTRTRTWTATDPCGNTATCARSITVQDVTPPPVPANAASTVACPALAIAPVPPVVIDACAGAITPTGPVILNSPNPLTCEGTRTFTFTFTDCSGNTSQWSHTYTIEREPFTIATPNGTATVDCPDDTDVAPTPPVVLSNCGEVLTPVLFSLGAKPGCEGNRQYIYRYTDCEGNFVDWLFTYLVEYLDFTVPASETVSVECPILASQPIPPVVFDNCGKLLNPTGPVITSTENAQGCEASRQFAWTYKDCEGNTHVWSKTYQFLYSADFFTFGDETNVVACLSYAVQPFPPTLYDACGQEIKAVLTNVSENIAASGCTGWRKFDFVYTDCGGHSHPWSFSYEINDNEAPLGNCPAGNGGPVTVNVDNLSCIAEVPCPDDYDFSDKIEEMLVAGDYFDVCSGDDLVVELQGASDPWQCADPHNDGQFTFGRTFYFRIADPCGNEFPGGCEVTFSGECLPIETFRQEDWGIAGELPGNAVSPATTDLAIIADLLANNPLIIGGNNRSLTLTNPQCIVDLLPSSGWPGILANCHQTNCTGCNPMGIGGMKNSLAANAIALTLNLRFNNEYKGLALNELRDQSLGCLALSSQIVHCPTETTCQLRLFDGSSMAHSFPYTLGGLLDMANKYLDGGLGLSIGQQTIYATAINQALQTVNTAWSDDQVETACDTRIASPIESGKEDFGHEGEISRGIDLILSPNPASRFVMLQIGSMDEERSVKVEVFNTLGNRLISNDLGKVASLRHRIELGGLKTGMYLVMVKIAGHRPMVEKLFVNEEGGVIWR
ncbi:MAG: hypothetical protein IPN76_21715 [Saprospiraceae bacterium]|nr:hypothetical protein [Saprospiraceae bacterium]